MPMIILLVLLQVDVLLEGMKFLVKLSAHLDLGREEVQLVLVFHFDVLVVAVDARDRILD